MKKFFKFTIILIGSIGIITVDNYFTAQYGYGIGDIAQAVVTGFGAIGMYALGRIEEAKERNQN